MKNFFKVALFLAAIIAWVTYSVTQVSFEIVTVTTTLGMLGIVAAGVVIGVFIMWLFDWLD